MSAKTYEVTIKKSVNDLNSLAVYLDKKLADLIVGGNASFYTMGPSVLALIQGAGFRITFCPEITFQHRRRGAPDPQIDRSYP